MKPWTQIVRKTLCEMKSTAQTSLIYRQWDWAMWVLLTLRLLSCDKSVFQEWLTEGLGGFFEICNLILGSMWTKEAKIGEERL